MTENTISILALALCLAPGILHSVEVAYPLLARWLANYVLPLLFEQRQGALAFLSVIAGAVYGLQLPLEDRAVLHLLLLVMSVLFMLVNANHAGIPFLGKHPKVSRNGRNVGIVFSIFWLAASALNYLAFSYASI